MLINEVKEIYLTIEHAYIFYFSQLQIDDTIIFNKKNFKEYFNNENIDFRKYINDFRKYINLLLLF